MTKLRKLDSFLLSIVVLYFFCVTFEVLYVIKRTYFIADNGDKSLSLLYGVFDFGYYQSVAMSSLKFLIVAGIGSFVFYYIKNSLVFINYQQRLGYKGFLKRASLQIFSTAAVLACLTELYQMLLLSLLSKPLHFFNPSPFLVMEKKIFFTPDSLVNTLLFLLTSAIGWGIFAVFVFAINLFIKKNVLCCISSLIIGILLIVFPGILNMVLGSSSIFSGVLYAIFVPALLAPGQMSFGGYLPPLNIGIAFLLTAVIYMTMTIIMMKLWLKKKRKFG